MKIVFFGTPKFAANTLSYLLEHNISIAAVITKPDKPQGRSGKLVSPPVKNVAESQNPPIPVYQPPLVSAEEFAGTLKHYDADLFIVVAYGEIIKQHLLDMPKLGCINVHASLLPKYRGAAPIQRSIIEGETETGVTIMHMAKKMDAGDIIKMVSIPIEPNMTAGELEEALCKIGCEALLNVVHAFEKGNVQRTAQDHSQATFAPKIELENCEIDWNLPAQKIHNLVRGVTPEPGAWCYVTIKDEKKRLKILKTLYSSEHFGTAGSVNIANKKALQINCGEGSLIITHLQLEGKKPMAGDEFARGYQNQLTFGSKND